MNNFLQFRWLTILMVIATAMLTGGCTYEPENSQLLRQTQTQSPTALGPGQAAQDELPSEVVIKTVSFPNLLINPVDNAALVFIPEGGFEMGADPERSYEICLQYREGCRLEDFADEQPVHIVFLDAYWIYQEEVSNGLYRACVEIGVCSLPAFTDFYNQAEYADHPVVYVDWYAAASYCEWAGGRLPTEAEWEKAARGTDGRMFPWGEAVSCEQANLSGCAVTMTMPGGSLPGGASPYGALEMAGNAAEWVADWYAPEYFQVSPESNPEGPPDGELKVIRGGSWKNPGVALRVTNRGGNYPEIFSTGIGFRCVIDPVE